MKVDLKEYLLLLILISIVLFGLVSGVRAHGEAIPMKNPSTGEEGYWISESDLQASIVAANTVDSLSKENEILKEKFYKSRRREAAEVGGLIGLLTYIILTLVGGR
jgi:hypothetical protein